MLDKSSARQVAPPEGHEGQQALAGEPRGREARLEGARGQRRGQRLEAPRRVDGATPAKL